MRRTSRRSPFARSRVAQVTDSPGSPTVGRASARAAIRETRSVLGSLVRNLLLLPLNGLVENLLYRVLILVVLVLLGHAAGLIAPPG
jgi:hypothetical protein